MKDTHKNRSLLALLAVPAFAFIAFFVLREPATWTDSDLFDAIATGDRHAIEDYLDAGGATDRSIEANGRVFTLLQAAVFDREEEIALLLLGAGVDMRESGVTLQQIGRNGLNEVLTTVLAKMSPDEGLGEYSGVVDAALNGYADTVEIYLSHGRGEGWSRQMNTAAGAALSVGYDDVTRLLLEGGAPLDDMLHSAARFSSPGMVRFLLARGLDANETVVVGNARESDVLLPMDLALQRLRRNQALINELPEDSYLFEFVDKDARYVIGELLRAGATPVEDAANVARDALTEISTLASVEKLLGAARLGLIDAVEELLANDTYDSETLREATIMAIRTDHDDVARRLLASGAPVDKGVLHFAAAASSPGLVRSLLRFGADPNEIYEGRRPLDFWLEQSATQDPALILHEMIRGGAEACWLVDRSSELPGSSSTLGILTYSAADCWDG